MPGVGGRRERGLYREGAERRAGGAVRRECGVCDESWGEEEGCGVEFEEEEVWEGTGGCRRRGGDRGMRLGWTSRVVRGMGRGDEVV